VTEAPAPGALTAAPVMRTAPREVDGTEGLAGVASVVEAADALLEPTADQ
jgi:hypothetical protein